MLLRLWCEVAWILRLFLLPLDDEALHSSADEVLQLDVILTSFSSGANNHAVLQGVLLSSLLQALSFFLSFFLLEPPPSFFWRLLLSSGSQFKAESRKLH